MADTALVERALADPSVGFAEIYDAYGDRLFDYCYGILRSTADASDALQDTFLAALDKLPQLRDPDKLRPWLYAIARSQCFRRTRSRQRERVSDTVGDTVIGDDDVDSSIETDHLPTLVWDTVAGLSEVDRAVIDLNVRHELEGEELASSLGVPSSKAYVMLHRAKARLETSIGALLVARAGTDECEELAGIVAGEDFTPLIRKRVARHIEGCAICEETRERNRPEALLALVPLLGAPAALREQILTAIGAAAPPSAGGSADNADGGAGGAGADALPGGPPSGGARWRGRRAQAPRQAAEQLDWDSSGFPNPIAATSVAGWVPAAVGGAIAAAILLIAGFVFVNRSDDSIVELAGGAEVTTTSDAATTEAPASVLGTTELPAAAATAAAPITGSTTSDAPTSTALTPAPTSDPEEAPPTTSTEPPPTTKATEPPTSTSTSAAVTTTTATTAAPTTTTTAPTTTSTSTSTSTTSTSTSTSSTTTTTTEAPDTTPPQVSRLRVVCGGMVLLSVDILDDTTEKLRVDIVASWDGGAAAFTRLGGSTYGVEIARDLLPDGLVTFTVTGTAADLAGNETNVSWTGSCTNIN